MSSINEVERKDRTPNVDIAVADNLKKDYDENINNLCLVKEITVGYDYSYEDNYSLTFEYDTDGKMNRMNHIFVSNGIKQKDVYEVSDKITFCSYRLSNNEWIRNFKHKNCEYTEMGYISKKQLLLTIVKYMATHIERIYWMR